MSDAEPAEFSRHGLFPTPEQRLVLTAALADTDAEAMRAYERWRATLQIEDPFDREVFRLLPLMYERLHRIGVNDALMPRLRGTYRQAWARNHQLLQRMRPVVDALAHANVRMLLIKGAPMAQAYYENVAVRPMDDVDLCVRREQLDHAMHTLAAIGFRPERPVDARTLRNGHAVPVRRGEEPPFDLHWDVAFECAGSASEVYWQYTEPIDFLGQSVQMQRPTQLLMHTVVHGMRWNEEPPVRWVADAAFILQRRGAQIDWPQIVQQAVALGLNHRLWLGLKYLHETMRLPVPAAAVQQLGAAPLNWVQRLERDTVLRNQRLVYEQTLGPLRLVLTNYLRRAAGPTALHRAWNMLDYLREIFHQESRLDLFGFLGYGMYSRLLRRPWLALRHRMSRGT